MSGVDDEVLELLVRAVGGVELANAALELCAELTVSERFTCIFVKHTNACGVGVADDPIDAYRRAYLGDPNAAMGGILAVNFTVDAAFAEAVMDSLATWGKAAGAGAFFIEVWLAPAPARSSSKCGWRRRSPTTRLS